MINIFIMLYILFSYNNNLNINKIIHFNVIKHILNDNIYYISYLNIYIHIFYIN